MKFCRHSWGRWSYAIRAYGGSLHQVCACTKCGAIQHRKAIGMMTAHLEAHQVNEALRDTAQNIKEKT